MKHLVNKQNLFALVMLIILGINVISCTKDNVDDSTALDPAMVAALEQYVDNVVIETYKDLADASMEMNEAVAKLNTPGGITEANVAAACQLWIKSRKYWEQSEAFLFGAAGDYNIDPHIDSWPLDQTQLDNLLSNETIMENFDADYAAENLAGGLLGFHAIEYVIFRDGGPRPFTEITENEGKYAAGIAEDLMRNTIRLEAAWAGMENITNEKQTILTDNELEPTRNYGDELKAAGMEGNRKYPTLKSGFEEVINGAIVIADEVGNAKISDPVESGNVLDVESWYSWNSLTDFQDNIISIENAYLGGVEDKRDETKSISAHIKKLNPTIDAELRAAIDTAIVEIQGIGEPFRDHLNQEDTEAAVAACNALMEKLEQAKSLLN